MAKEKAEVVKKEESAEKKEFRELIKKYKEQNPLKYADKEEALLKKLESL